LAGAVGEGDQGGCRDVRPVTTKTVEHATQGDRVKAGQQVKGATH
jgi:hypothetical protein